MIKVAGNVERSFVFPAPRAVAFRYYTQLQHIVRLLPHISLETVHTPSQLRVRYSTLELGLYRVTMLCDIEAIPDEQAWVLSIQPLPESPAVKQEANLYSLTGQGFYASQSIFQEDGEQTRIEYSLALWADLPVPFGAQFMPQPILNGLARTISNYRIHEIAEGFIQTTIEDFRSSQH